MMHFWQEHHREVSACFSECIIARHVTPVCPIAGDVNFDDLVKVVSASSFHCEVTVSPFIIYSLRLSLLVLVFHLKYIFLCEFFKNNVYVTEKRKPVSLGMDKNRKCQSH